MSENQKEIDILLAEKEVNVDGEIIVIKPYSWVQSMKIVQPLGVIINVVVRNIGAIEEALNGFANDENKFNRMQSIVNLVSEIDFEEVVDAFTTMVQIATGKPREYIKNLMIDDAFVLGSTIYDVNKSFFKQRLTKIKLPSEKKK